MCNDATEFLKSECQCYVDLNIDFASLAPLDEGVFQLRKP